MYTHHKPLRYFRVVSVLVALMMCLTAFSPVAGQAPSAAVAPVAGSASSANAHTKSSAWGTGTLTEAEIDNLISQMTLDEKDTFVHGSGAGSGPGQTPCADNYVSPWVQGCTGEAGRIPGVARLGIPPLRLTDGPAGLRLGHQATAMPAPVGLAATFDPDAANLFGVVAGKEGRALNEDVWLAPMMNQVGIPTAGRNFETLGEDPYLASQLVTPLVEGVQSEGFMATLKHYITNDFENGRNSTSVKIDERTFQEMELQPFEAGVKAGAGSVMCSYNRINDVYGCGNDWTLNQILRGQLGFAGFVMSDWGATHRTTDMIYGLDMEQSGSSNLGNALINAVMSGTTAVSITNDYPAYPAYTSAQWSAALDQSVRRILRQMNNAGLLEGTEFGSHATLSGTLYLPYVPPRPDLQVLQPSSFAAAQSIAEESATLLRNEGSALPLTRRDLSGNGVLVMGPTAIAAYVGGGGSAHVIPFDYPYDPLAVQGPYDALVAAAGAGANIKYVPGYDLDGLVVPSSVLMAPDTANPYTYWTLRAEDAAFNNLPGLLRQQITTDTVPSGQQPVLYTAPDAAPDQLDATIDYITTTLPISTAWRWTGLLTAPATPVSGTYQLKIFVANQRGAQLFVDGLSSSGGSSRRRINIGSYPAFPNGAYASQGQTSKSHDPNLEGLQQSTWSVTLTATQQLHLDLRVYTGGTDPTKVQFRWIPIPDDWQTAKINEAVAAATMANKVVILAYDEGSEGQDRGGNNPAAGMALPGYQDALISAVAAANPNTIVVLNTGDPVYMPWANDVKAILEMWYPGQRGGPATANVLLGKVNPSGKLPVTFPITGTLYPQYDPNCVNYGTASSGPGNSNPDRQIPDPGTCPLYPGIYQQGFLWASNPASGTLHSYREIDFTTNGIFQGYRWYDKNNVAPLFPFGHGLSYTQFKYSNLMVKPRGDGLDVSFLVRNIGSREGAEVPQVYLGPPSNPPVPMAQKALVGFDRIELKPGHAKWVTVHIGKRELSFWSTTVHDWVLAAGSRPIYVGSSSRDIRLTGTATVRATIEDLVQGMTLDEKLGMLHGIGFFGTPARCLGSAGYVVGVERLGIPGLCMSDGPAGVRVSNPATALPAPVALVSTFDPDTARLYGQVIGNEGRAYGQDVLLSPMVNLVRVPQAGRAFETLGEDPLLANRIVAQEVSGLNDAGLIATIKHYAENNQENNRQGVNVNVDEQTLHEIELMGFEGAINAGAGAVMCAYNKVNGTYSCENSVLLNDILRTQWDFTGFVMTDWFASHPSGVNALTAGLDMEMPGEVAFGAQLKNAVTSGTIPLAAVDQAVKRILTSMDKAGLLTGALPSGGTPVVPPRPSIDAIKDADATIARDVAEQGAVLLRNEHNTLPLGPDDLRSLVVVGPTAKTPLVGGGGSARVTPFHAVSTLDALTQTVGAGGHVTYVKGIDLDGVVVPASVLMLTQTYNGDTEINHTGANALPSTTMPNAYTWAGTLTVPAEGDYDLKVQNSGGQGALRVDGAQVVSIGGFFGGGSLIPTADGLTNNSATMHLMAGAHAITLTVGAGGFGPPPYSPTGPIQLRFAWVTPPQRQANLDEAVAAAHSAKAVVVFGYVEGTEGADRTSLALPGNQNALISAVTAANPNNVVVLNIPAAVTMPWVNQTGAILNMWFPGQEGGWATADLLLGKANPGGKLPETFPVSANDLSFAGDPAQYPGVGNQEYYSETIFMGYRWFDKQNITPLFPFGHGLSYTKFKYSNLMVMPSHDGFDVLFLVRNIGPREGAEVPQVYVGPPSTVPAGVQMAQKALVGFDRIELKPGQVKFVKVHVGERELSYWSASQHDWVVAAGRRPVYVGSSSRDIRLQGTIQVEHGHHH